MAYKKWDRSPRRKSPTRSDFSIEDVGIVYASIRNVLNSDAAITAKKIASTQFLSSLLLLFFFFLFFQNVQFIVFQNIMSATNSGKNSNHSPPNNLITTT